MNKLGLNQGATTSHGLKDDVQYKEFLSSFQHHFDMMLTKTNIKKGLHYKYRRSLGLIH